MIYIGNIYDLYMEYLRANEKGKKKQGYPGEKRALNR